MAFPALLAAADRAALQHLGGAVVYAAGAGAGGASASVLGVFDATYVRQLDGQPGVVSSGPACFLRLEDLPSDPETDLDARLTIAGVTYRIHTPKKDGMGGVLCQLLQVT